MKKNISLLTTGILFTLFSMTAYAAEKVIYLFPAPDFLPAFSPFQLARHKGYYSDAGLDVSFQVEEGELVGFLGPNGAGKTTTLKMLAGLLYPSAGSAKVLGYTPWERHDGYRRQFALLLGQKNQLWWDLPAQESFRLHQHPGNPAGKHT